MTSTTPQNTAQNAPQNAPQDAALNAPLNTAAAPAGREPTRFNGLIQLKCIEMKRADGPVHMVGAAITASSFTSADLTIAKMRRSVPEDSAHSLSVKVIFSDGASISGDYALRRAGGEDLETYVRRNLLGALQAGEGDSVVLKKFLTQYALGQNGVLERAEAQRAAKAA